MRIRTFFKQIATSVVLFTSFSVLAAPTVIPNAPKIAAKGYLLMDYTTGKIIVSENEQTQLAPASLTKMMTSYVLGSEIKEGKVSPSDEVVVSKNAWAANRKFKGSSLMYIEVDKKVRIEDLNRGIIIQSGNDACVAIAEHLAGSEDAFADLMNAYAQQIGMSNSHFMNSHGLPAADHYTTPLDMAKLARALVANLPEEYALYSEKSFTYNDIKQYNRNSLLWDKSLHVDGIKTGHTEEAGYSLVSSATQNDMRLIAVVMGTKSERARKDESKKLLSYGFRFFETVTPYAAGQSFASERVWFGDKEKIELGTLQPIAITIPRGQGAKLKADFELNQRPEAPLSKGDEVGKVHLTLDGKDIAEFPLVALEDVEEGGAISKMIDQVLLLAHDWLN